MSRAPLLAALTLLAAALAAPAPALAKPGDAACVWAHVPQAKKDILVAAYRKDPNAAFGGDTEAQVAPEIDKAVPGCHVTTPMSNLPRAMAGTILMDLSGTVLKSDYGISPTPLLAAWADLPPADRARVSAYFNAPDSAPRSDADTAFVNEVLGRLQDRLKFSDQATGHVAMYLLGHAWLEANDI
jgi:hypothetical protein